MLYFLLSTLVLTLYIDVVLSLSIWYVWYVICRILFSSLLCSLWWVQIVGYVLACRSCSFVCIIIVQTYLKTLNLLDISLMYIWGCMCSTGPFQFRWLRGCIHSSCYYHHQIGSIRTHYHIFPWLCAWDVCYIIFCHFFAYTFRENRDFVFIINVQFMMSANSRILFGLQIVFVCLYITPPHYHHCAILSEDIELIRCLSDIFCCVCE